MHRTSQRHPQYSHNRPDTTQRMLLKLSPHQTASVTEASTAHEVPRRSKFGRAFFPFLVIGILIHAAFQRRQRFPSLSTSRSKFPFKLSVNPSSLTGANKGLLQHIPLQFRLMTLAGINWRCPRALCHSPPKHQTLTGFQSITHPAPMAAA